QTGPVDRRADRLERDGVPRRVDVIEDVGADELARLKAALAFSGAAGPRDHAELVDDHHHDAGAVDQPANDAFVVHTGSRRSTSPTRLSSGSRTNAIHSSPPRAPNWPSSSVWMRCASCSTGTAALRSPASASSMSSTWR